MLKMTEDNSTPTGNGSSNLEIAQSNQDLIITKGSRKKRNVIIACVASAIILALVIAAIVLLTRSDGHKDPEPSYEALKLEDFLNYKYNPKSFNATWASENQLLYNDADGNLILLNLDSDTSTVLLNSNDSIMTTAFEHKLSADGNYLLVAYGYQKLYRHSFKARYTIIDIETGERTNLQAGANGADLQLVVWAPVGNALVFVHNNNIYYKNSPSSTEVQITNVSGFITTGVPDWVYEEEVFSSNQALWFSPDGKKLAYAQFNDTDVPLMVIPIYGEPGSLVFQYPRASIVKYPKAGTPNPTVSLHVVTLETPDEILQLQPATSLQNLEPILTAVTWATNDTVTAVWMNRVQNMAVLLAYQANSNTYSTTTIKSINETSGWLELFTPPIISGDGTKMALLLSHDQDNNVGAYRHLTLIDIAENGATEALTSGTYVVTEILGWDTEDNLIYYTANTDSDSSVQHLYSISPVTKDITCVSCLTRSRNNDSQLCTYNSAEFGPGASHYALTCAGPEVPHIDVYKKDGTVKHLWVDNQELNEVIEGKLLPTKVKFEFEVAGGYKAQVLLRLPPNADLSGKTKYPMLVNVYGGPDTFQVIDKFTLDWGSYLTANKSIIYATIDGRGSGLKGDKILFSGYRKLGTVEVVDQINVTRILQENLPYIDASRTGIWGWSYGGYAAGMALATDTQGVFKCGISVAPVTDWSLYDSIYTERFMGLPTIDDNYQAYYDSQLLTKYAGLKDKQYFLIHGTFDDNVHYQQSMMWAKMLERNDILFRQLSYTDEDHGLGSVRPHLYHSLENFLDECFVSNA